MTNDNLNNCLSCSSEMSTDDNFCQECGSPREIHEISSARGNGPLEQYRSNQSVASQLNSAHTAAASESNSVTREQMAESIRASRMSVNSEIAQAKVENQRTTSTSLKAHTLESPLLRRNSGYQERLNSAVAENHAGQGGGFKDVLSKLPFPKGRIMPVFVTELAAGALMLVAVGYAVHYFAGANSAKPVNSLKATQATPSGLSTSSISTEKIALSSSLPGDKSSGAKEILGFDNAKKAYECGDYNSTINFMENLFLVKDGALSDDERTLFDDALFARGRQRLEKQQFRLATSDMLRVSEYYPKYDEVRQYMKDNCTNYKEEIMREGAKAKETKANIASTETTSQPIENTAAMTVQATPVVSQTKVTTTTVTTSKSASRDLAISTTSQPVSQPTVSQQAPVKSKSKVESVSQNTQPLTKTWKRQAPETLKSTTAESSETKGHTKNNDDLLTDSSMNTSSVVNSLDSNSTSQANAARIKRIAQKLGGSKAQAKASDEDVAKYNELLAEYFSRGASDGEPPTLNEWVSKGKPEF